MPWSNEGGGGPWQPKNQGPKNQGPWGQGPGGNGGGNKGGGGQPPDLEELLRRSKDRFKNVLPPGGGTGLGGVGGKGIAALVMLAILGWLATGFYTVRTNEVALQLLFGRFVGKTTEGLNYNWPYPIGGVIKVPVTDVKNIEVGQSVQTGRGQQLATDSLMLTSDANIVDIAFSIQWRISPTAPEAYVFNIQTPDNTIKAVAESAIREVVGRRDLQRVLPNQVAVAPAAQGSAVVPAPATPVPAASAASAQTEIQDEVQRAIQKVLDEYRAGVVIDRVNITRIAPPQEVLAAFRDVQAAAQDQERLRNEAQTYAGRVVPEARGQAERLLQEAQAYRERTVAEAQGAASRFRAVFDEYQKAPDVTRERIYLETMERVFGGMDKIILDNNANGGQGAVPYLPLNELTRRPQAQQPGGQQTPGVPR